MKKRAWLGICLSLILVFGMALGVCAKETYTYTVRIYAGVQGTFTDGSKMLVYNNLHYNDRINFSLNQVVLNEGSKYYVKGIRESGHDNSEVGNLSFPVTRDVDYVVAYGILSNAVAYTVNYVDRAGNALAPSETYYGNVGDRPVVAHLYIEGYLPQAYNLTRTLTANAAENVFDFVYTRIAVPTQPVETTPAETTVTPGPGPEETTPEVGPGPEETTPEGGPGPEETTPEGGPGPEETTPEGGPGPEETTPEVGPGPGPEETTPEGGSNPEGTTPGGEVTPPGPGTETTANPEETLPGGDETQPGTDEEPTVPAETTVPEIIDIDNPDNPLSPGESKGLSPWAIGGIAAGGAGLIGLLVFLFLRKKKEKDEDEE